MQISRLEIGNWKNFKEVALPLHQRVFIVGPNASGKSNLLDAIRFLRDIADPEGGFVTAVGSRGGVSQIKCLHARRVPEIMIEVGIRINVNQWVYRLEFKQDKQRRPIIQKEVVHKNDEKVLDRPTDEDLLDVNRLSQTHLEQVNANKDFREVADFLSNIRYLHVVPQLVRDPDRGAGRKRDPFGSDFLEQVARTNSRTLKSRLRRINDALRVAVPQLRELKLARDERGVPHLQGLYEHWRPNAGWQTEEQFSDGTLRLLGLLWALLDGTRPLLLEEPELSLHGEVVRQIPSLIQRISRKHQRQTIISTHSADLLSDPGIAAEEVILLEPSENGTQASLSSSYQDVRALLDAGIPMSDVVLPRTAPGNAQQLALFGG